VSDHEFTKEVTTDRKRPCEVTFEVGESIFQGTSMHFNEKGMLVLCKAPAPLNAKGKLTLRFPSLNNAIELNGEVVWTNIYGAGDSFSPKGMGIRYINADRDVERLLGELAEQYESLGSIYTCYYS
jgi:hypothetical protein